MKIRKLKGYYLEMERIFFPSFYFVIFMLNDNYIVKDDYYFTYYIFRIYILQNFNIQHKNNEVFSQCQH